MKKHLCLLSFFILITNTNYQAWGMKAEEKELIEETQKLLEKLKNNIEKGLEYEQLKHPVFSRSEFKKSIASYLREMADSLDIIDPTEGPSSTIRPEESKPTDLESMLSSIHITPEDEKIFDETEKWFAFFEDEARAFTNFYMKNLCQDKPLYDPAYYEELLNTWKYNPRANYSLTLKEEELVANKIKANAESISKIASCSLYKKLATHPNQTNIIREALFLYRDKKIDEKNILPFLYKKQKERGAYIALYQALQSTLHYGKKHASFVSFKSTTPRFYELAKEYMEIKPTIKNAQQFDAHKITLFKKFLAEFNTVPADYFREKLVQLIQKKELTATIKSDLPETI